MAIPDSKEDVAVDLYPRYERLRRECPAPRVAGATGLQTPPGLKAVPAAAPLAGGGDNALGH